MPVEENKELTELVSHTLQTKGVLQKVQAEIRASVFLALEEQDLFKDKNPFINTPLKKFVATSEGLLAVSLIKEFLEFFNLEFSSMVFDPETHAGIDYTCLSRQNILKELNIGNESKAAPLLSLVLKALTTVNNIEQGPSTKNDIFRKDEKVTEQNILTNGILGHPNNKEKVPKDRISFLEETDTEYKKESEYNRFGFRKEASGSSSLASLVDLPPLTKPAVQTTSSNFNSINHSTSDVKNTYRGDEGSGYEDILSSKLQQIKGSNNDGNISEGSEVDEEVSEPISGLTDDNTVDVSISKESGKADYLEDIQNSNLID